MRLIRALVTLYQTYHHRAPAARLHILIRFLTCPFLRVLRFVPPDARSLLEVGAGHGVFSRLAGLPRVVAVEPDLRKMGPVEGVQLIVGYDETVRGQFDVVAMMDVLYAIPMASWDALLSRLHERLAPGGTLLIKEQDPSSIKNRWNRAQEWISMRLLRITMANAFDYESREAFAARLTRLGFRDVSSKRVDFGYPHPHLLFIARKSGSTKG
ncbi:MAG TPA: class I SAM-dependent methyltransferase [Thermoanaerobaculia bacterium]|nr:class I SAM-dependent methyltransferase [Thermoanaerobaculia bacterium]